MIDMDKGDEPELQPVVDHVTSMSQAEQKRVRKAAGLPPDFPVGTLDELVAAMRANGDWPV